MKRWFALVLAVWSSAACRGGRSESTPPEQVPLPPLGDDARPAGAPAGDTALRVIDVVPATGAVAGGQALRIRGANFRTSRVVKVRFGSVDAEILRVTDDEITIQTPPGSAGRLVDITVVFDPGGDLRLPGAFTYVTKP